MRCKKHPSDLSSTTGVCASCLRQRLFAILTAQAQSQAQNQAQNESQQPPLSFPRSVSPYISHRKSDTTAAATWKESQLFYSTPQLGPASSVTVDIKNNGRKSSRGRISSFILGIFRSKSNKSDPDPNPVVVSIGNCKASPSLNSTMITGRRKKQVRTFSLDESIAIEKTCRDRGMSPVRYPDEEHCHGGLSGYSSESSEGWKQTPRRTPAIARRGGCKAAAGHSRNISGFSFCLSPLVRANPNVQRNQKGVTPETVANGEIRAPPKPHLAYAPSFCKNRSRKLADFGRYNNNPNY